MLGWAASVAAAAEERSALGEEMEPRDEAVFTYPRCYEPYEIAGR